MVRVSPHPPSFVSMPWYDLVVRMDAPPANYTSNSLAASFFSQTGIPTGVIVTFRLQSVRVWGALNSFTSATPMQPIVMVVRDPIGATATSAIGGTGIRALEQITDYPDLTRRAVVGYRYPKAQREFAFLTSGAVAGAVPLLALTGVGPQSVLYMSVQWRIDPASAPPNLDGTPAPAGWFS